MLETLIKMLAEEFNIEESEIDATSKLEADLGINSLELAELAFRLEDEFGVVIEDDAIPSLITVGDVANYLEEHKE